MTTIAAVTADGTRCTLSTADIGSLRSALRGEVIQSDHGSYEAARRVWNGNVDRRPALIARCTGVADVQQALAFARTSRIMVSVRGGGHGAPGYGTNDGGLVIDLSPMKGIHVDPGTRTARAQGGVLWRELDHETQAFGLATTGGTVSNTGIGGLTLGGGLGWLMGKHGLTVDNLLSADVVTADGQFKKASATENPDLFWALRGGGGNFGIVTSFEYRLHPVTQVLGGLVIYPLDQAREALRFYRDFCPGLPDEAEAYCGLLTSPEGMPVFALILGYNGPIEDGEKVLAPARRFGRPVADLVGPMPYRARQMMLDEPNATHGLHRYWRSAFTEQISDRVIDVLVENAASFSVSAQRPDLLLHARGRDARPADRDRVRGAPAPVGLRCHRAVDGRCPVREHIAWVRALWSQLEPHLEGSAYVNHLAEDDRPEKVRASFGENYGRLRQLKAVYDPTNLFRINANIAPAG